MVDSLAQVILLPETRLEVGLTQVQLCERIGRPRNYVSKCESDERRVDVLEWAEFLAGCEADPVTFLVQSAAAMAVCGVLDIIEKERTYQSLYPLTRRTLRPIRNQPGGRTDLISGRLPFNQKGTR